MNVGDKIKLEGEKQRYTVQAFDDRFVIMTKPFNAKRTYLYTIADKKRMERGPIGLVFGMCGRVNNPTDAEAFLEEMKKKNWEISYRKSVDITEGEANILWSV